MAKKKVPSVEDAINRFRDVMLRASLSDYLYVNQTMISKNPKDNSIIIIPDQDLWIRLIDDEELKNHIKELDITNKDHSEQMKLCSYSDDLIHESWIEIDPNILFTGKIFKIGVKGFEYELPINRGLLPLKLRKAEYNNISYRVFTKPNLVLALKKRFDFPAIENCGFTMIRMFQII